MSHYEEALPSAEDSPAVPWPNGTRYERWCAEQHIPIVKGFRVPDLDLVDTAEWAAAGAAGAIIDLEGTGGTNGAYLLRVGARDSTKWMRHLFEEVLYVVKGSGITEVRTGRNVVSTQWGPGSLFATPLNTEYRHIAVTDAVIYGVHTAPLVMNLFHNDAFVEGNPFSFDDRFDGREDFFSTDGRMWKHEDGSKVWETNFIKNVVELDLPQLYGRGAKGNSVSFQLGENTLAAHISEFSPGTYKKAHRHGPGAHVILLGGDGYSLLWQHSFDEQQKVEWTKNSVFVPPNYWFHQHFNVGTQPARYLAIRWGSRKHPLDHSSERVIQDRRLGGDQIEYDDQDPRVHQLFAEQCAQHGTEVMEDALH